MSMLSVRSVAGPVLLALVFVPVVRAEDGAEDKDRFFDLRVGVTSSPAPSITEKVKPKGSPSSKYEWQGVRSHGGQVDVSANAFCLHGWGGLGGGVHVIGADYDITPKSLRRNSDGAIFSPGGQQLHYRTLGVQVDYGYGYATSRDPEDLALYLEVAPFVGGGGAEGETSGANSAGNTVRRSGYGYYYEWGVRGGAYLTERSFVFGITSFYANGAGRVNIDLKNGARSRMTLEREGFGIGAEAGWRF